MAQIVKPTTIIHHFPNADVSIDEAGAWVAARTGHRFHVVDLPSSTTSDGEKTWFREYVHAEVHTPSHESQTREDVEGSTYAWVEDGKWLYAACSPEEHRQFAADAEAFAVGQFSEAIQESNAKIGYNAANNAARNTAYAKSQALIKFAGLVGRRVHEVVVSETLGHYHRNPHEDHQRQLTVAAIDRVLGAWKQNSAADATARANHAYVEVEAGEVRKRLTGSDVIETRAERVKRFYRLSARGQDPLDCVEYIYTSSVDGETITGAANLPLATWAFDIPELVKGAVRGDYKYFDGIPFDMTPDRPYAVRFRRPVSPANSAWTQEPAIRIYG